MALVKCSECGSKVSTETTACPKCGAPKEIMLQVKKKPEYLGVIGAIIVLAVIGRVFTHNSVTDIKDPDKNVAEESKRKMHSFAGNAAIMLRKSMRDPDSFQLESAYINDEADTGCFTYHARNGFGGMNYGQAVVNKILGLVTNDTKGFNNVWNQNCKNPMNDESIAAKVYLKGE